MKKRTRIPLAWLALLGLFALSCRIFTPQPTPTSSANPTSTPTTAPAGPCQLNAEAEITIYERPSNSADIFSIQPAGFTATFVARTADGWLGFDPAIAQAANIGPFRLRWVPPGSSTLIGSCSELPVVWGPPPGICFDMPMQDTNVYQEPDTGATVVAVLHVEEFAAVVGLTAAGDWARVDLGPGNTGSTAMGWIEAATLNMNGPCDGLPTVTP
jgi:hypothetical protein